MKIPERNIFWARDQAEKGLRVRPVGESERSADELLKLLKACK